MSETVRPSIDWLLEVCYVKFLPIRRYLISLKPSKNDIKIFWLYQQHWLNPSCKYTDKLLNLPHPAAATSSTCHVVLHILWRPWCRQLTTDDILLNTRGVYILYIHKYIQWNTISGNMSLRKRCYNLLLALHLLWWHLFGPAAKTNWLSECGW